MNQDRIIVHAPAKLNLFLKILKKRKDGYHDIRSGVTLINLFDVIEIKKSDKMSISYTGTYKPNKGYYSDCIINKTLAFLNIKNKYNLEINIKKNIPVEGGLGSASTNAAALINGLIEMQLIESRRFSSYVSLGADIPLFLFGQDCLVRGKGELITEYKFPKYYFLLVKPNLNLSTRDMYKKFSMTKSLKIESIKQNIINDHDTGNDFESILYNDYKDIYNILKNLKNLKAAIFSRLTGSGSCCYAVFESKQNAIEAQIQFRSEFKNLWNVIVENNDF